MKKKFYKKFRSFKIRMDSLFSRRSSSTTSSLLSSLSSTDSSPNNALSSSTPQYDVTTWNSSGKENEENSVPAWRRPLNSSLRRNLYRRNDSNESSKKKSDDDDDDIFKSGTVSQEIRDSEATAKLIQILLPCIICNRTFSPEALERHSKICSSVNIKDPRRPARGKFDSAEQRKKETVLADYIPPPPVDANGEFIRMGSRRLRDSFKRGSAARSSLGKSPSSTTASDFIPTWRRGLSPAGSRTAPSVHSNSSSENHHGNNGKSLEPYDNTSEFGSEESQETTSNIGSPAVPSYARAISPTEDCPYCGRNFITKAFDRHLKFCQDQYVKKQYEIQPTPKEKEEALERQEIRTKYRPLKNSSSCGSLRSMSPGREFSSMMAMKLYGFVNRTLGRNNNGYNFKKSNESLTNSCYGDYRNMRRTSPAPSSMSNSSHRPGLLQRSATTMTGIGMGHHLNSRGAPVMRVNTSSNIPQKKTKSIEHLNLSNVPSSGYGQQYMNSTPSPFVRNSKTHSSLHKNFFRNTSKRAEPDGTDSITSSMYSPSKDVNPQSSLIITPMNLYTKGSPPSTKSSMIPQYQYHNVPKPNPHSTTPSSINHHNQNNDNNSFQDSVKKGDDIINSQTSYDPYEKAAKQFEELLKSQPLRTGNNNGTTKQSRKVGLDRAFQSVNQPLESTRALGNGKLFSGSYSTEKENEGSERENSSRYRYGQNTGNGPLGNNTAGDISKSNHRNKTEIDSFVFNPTTDDSYWDSILAKNPSQQPIIKTSTSSQQQHSRNSPAPSPASNSSSDSGNGKSRASALSNNSSDLGSVFTPSDGADLEFEALESLMSVGDLPSSSSPLKETREGGPASSSVKEEEENTNNINTQTESTTKTRPSFQRQQTYNTTTTATSSSSPLFAPQREKSNELSTSLRRKNENSTEDYRRWNRQNNDDDFKRNKEDTITPVTNTNNTSNYYNSPSAPTRTEAQQPEAKEQAAPALAKFCHECGTLYPTSRAKFCPECGERRANS